MTGVVLSRISSIILVASIIPAPGCSNTEMVLRPDLLSPDQRVAQASSITRVFVGREVDVVPRGNGRKHEPIRKGMLAPMDGESFLLYEAPEEASRIPFEHVRSITTNDRGAGALNGLLAGAIPGAIAGFLLGAYAGGMSCVGEDENGMSPPCHFANYAKPIVGFALAGALLTGGLVLLC